MSTAIILCRVPERRLYQQKSVVVAGTLQFIVHVYTLVALRLSNQSLLDNIALEESWGFGQVIAVVMLAATLLECAKALEGSLSSQKGPHPAHSFVSRILLLGKSGGSFWLDEPNGLD